MTVDRELSHEHIVVRRGVRSRLPIIVAVHSTVLGPAVGGCRLQAYGHWREGLADALRLSAAMTAKCAVADLDHGGGKAVIVVPDSVVITAGVRQLSLLDLGDVVEGLGGQYVVGPAVGTGIEDMAVIRRRTAWAARHDVVGPAGPMVDPTALGVYEAIRAVARRALRRERLAGVRITVVGLGRVGRPLLELLAAEGATLAATDTERGRRGFAAAVGARWLEPEQAPFAETDILVPCALGHLLSPASAQRLRCSGIAGAANNQLSAPHVADTLAERGILWAPDFVANAGGVIFGTTLDAGEEDEGQALARVRHIGPRLDSIFARASIAGESPLKIAVDDAKARIAAATGG